MQIKITKPITTKPITTKLITTQAIKIKKYNNKTITTNKLNKNFKRGEVCDYYLSKMKGHFPMP
jgi:hypothetical protein